MQINALTSTPKASSDRVAKAAHAAQEFEAMFATQMLSPMMETTEVNETFGGGHGEEMMRGMLMQEYGKAVAASGSLGLAHHIRQEMLKQQEAP